MNPMDDPKFVDDMLSNLVKTMYQHPEILGYFTLEQKQNAIAALGATVEVINDTTVMFNILFMKMTVSIDPIGKLNFNVDFDLEKLAELTK